MIPPSRAGIQLKYFIVFFLTSGIIIIVAPLSGMYTLKQGQLRNEAKTLADQVISFRTWISGTGVVWVDHLTHNSPDFLSKRTTESGTFFSKNPALATRELSEIVSKSNSRATFRVTSDNYRDSKNAPDDFEINAIQFLKHNKNKTYVEDFEGEFYRYAQPIYITKDCLKCHGNPKDAPPEVFRKYIYRAFDYKEGMMRGIISVKLPNISLWQVIKVLITPYSAGLLIGALLINIFFIQYMFVHRLRELSAITIDISEGELYCVPPARERLRDEVDQVSHSIDMLRNSLLVIVDHLQKKESSYDAA